jgi:hypothetical protein
MFGYLAGRIKLLAVAYYEFPSKIYPNAPSWSRLQTIYVGDSSKNSFKVQDMCSGATASIGNEGGSDTGEINNWADIDHPQEAASDFSAFLRFVRFIRHLVHSFHPM